MTGIRRDVKEIRPSADTPGKWEVVDVDDIPFLLVTEEEARTLQEAMDWINTLREKTKK